MKVLLAHNYYQKAGGEDAVFKNEKNLLISQGHSVEEFIVSNDIIKSFFDKLSVGFKCDFSERYFEELTKIAESFQPDVVHVHNFFPLITPSIHKFFNQKKIPTVQTLHNYRLACLNGQLLYKSEVCEKCPKGSLWQGVKNKCYKGSYSGSYFLKRMIENSRKNNIWTDHVKKIICLTEFQKNKLIEFGFSEHNLVVKSNFLDQEAFLPKEKKNQFLFVGRLSKEKGLDHMIRAFNEMTELNLTIAGDGEDRPLYESLVTGSNIQFVGWQSKDEITQLMRDSKALIFPSIWYEGMPMTLLEAFANGLPVICGDIGSMSTIITNEKTGLFYKPGSVENLKEKVSQLNGDIELQKYISQQQNEEYTNKYTSAMNYKHLTSIYKSAMESF